MKCSPATVFYVREAKQCTDPETTIAIQMQVDDAAIGKFWRVGRAKNREPFSVEANQTVESA